MTTSATATATPLFATLLDAVTPLFKAGGLAAAQQAIDAYRPTAADQLISICQIIGFAMSSLDSLGLSVPATLSASMKMKLRGNANALARISGNATKILESQRRHAEFSAEPDIPEPSIPAPEPSPPPQPPTAAENQRDRSWAGAMNDVAAELTAELTNLPAAQRHLQHRRITALQQTASTLNSGKAPPLRARLLGSAALLNVPKPPRT
jgi:hypothetical protein